VGYGAGARCPIPAKQLFMNTTTDYSPIPQQQVLTCSAGMLLASPACKLSHGSSFIPAPSKSGSAGACHKHQTTQDTCNVATCIKINHAGSTCSALALALQLQARALCIRWPTAAAVINRSPAAGHGGS
jgi:hypothetical protein